ncbi:MAG: Slam-dependent surface lipoprotein [Neisseria sp.]|nr:Slam-dependent surface lipoprotein [Neisseria sp.]
MSVNKTLLAALLVGAFGMVNAATIEGKSSKPNLVNPGSSNTIPFGSGKPGLSINGSNSINLEGGPIKYIRQKYSNTAINGSNVNANVNGNSNPKYLELKDVNPVIGLFTNPTLGQIWYENRAHGTEVYSVRQIANPNLPAAPKFGGLVMAKVTGLPADTAVYFGEWAPRAGNPSTGSSTDLNMASSDRTVWYVGENPTGNTKGLAAATYDVVGVNKHTPGQNDFYTGAVTATFGTGSNGTMAGGISRGNDTLNFNGVTIDNGKGTFTGAQGIDGRFYGSGAAAMAGIATRGTGPGDDIAFGGKKR